MRPFGWLGWFKRVERKLDDIERKVDQVSVDQTQFDADLQVLIGAVTDIGTAVTTLDTAVDAWIAAHPPGTDLTAEDKAVLDAVTALKATTQAATDETAKVTPPTA